MKEGLENTDQGRDIQKTMVSSRRRLDSLSPKKVHDTSTTSDSGPWLPTPIEFEYRQKNFNDPRNKMPHHLNHRLHHVTS